MNKIITLSVVLSLLFQYGAYAQNAQGCDGVRYYYDVFSEVTSTTVQYGNNITAGGNNVNLKMDVFEPVGDTQAKRPLMIWAHGGAFVTGERAEMDSLCYRFAKKGFVAATISYRLYPALQLGIPDSIGMLDAAIKSMGDLKAAIRHFRQDEATVNQFRIDSNFIYVGGVSAGAIMAVQVGYLDATDSFPDYFSEILNANGGLEGNTGDAGNQSYSSKVNGVFNLSGAIHKLDWMQADEPPIASYHGDEDDVIPYNHGLAALYGFEFMSLNGSGSIHTRADDLGIANFLVTAPGADHETAYGGEYNDYLVEFINEGQVFLYDLLCEGIPIDVDEVLAADEVKVFPNPSKDFVTLDLLGWNGAYHVAVYDVTGKLLLEDSNLRNTQYHIRKSNVGGGIFFVQIRSEDAGNPPVLKKIIFE